MSEYYNINQSAVELVQLCEYYKYYLPISPIMHREYYKMMAIYTEKKKEIVYRKLQKILNLSCVSNTEKSEKVEIENTNIDGEKTQLTNILQ
jgi:hypothetical protein